MMAAPALHADVVVNRVTLTGKITTATEAVVKETATSSTSTSKLKSQSITNAAILDALVANEDISDKRGYTIVEIFTTEGASTGFFARNSRSGDTVPIAPALLSGFSDSNLVTAESSSSRTSGDVVTETASSAYSGVAASTLFNTSVSVFLTGSTASHVKSIRIDGEATKIPYVSTSYSAVLTGATADEVINAKLASSGSAFVVEDAAP
ncbi:MAG: hypothetical protein JWO82_3926 [Akkermansiaceae bacterium]|nr:hypothetical protein [Akkermansiaceae bacterium]